MREVLEDHISPADLSKKYNISAHSIRDWVKKAGHQLPKSYKRFPYAAICCLASFGSAFLPLSKYAFISFACMPHICIPLCMNVSLSLNFHVYFSEMYSLQHSTFIYSSAIHIRVSCAMLTSSFWDGKCGKPMNKGQTCCSKSSLSLHQRVTHLFASLTSTTMTGKKEIYLRVEQHFASVAKYQDCPTNASLPVPPPLPPAPSGEQQLSPNSRTFFRRLPSLQGFHPHVGQEAWTSCCPRTTKLYIVG